MWTPPIAAAPGSDSWHPDDMLLLPLRALTGEILGVVSVDEPLSGQRPTRRRAEDPDGGRRSRRARTRARPQRRRPQTADQPARRPHTKCGRRSVKTLTAHLDSSARRGEHAYVAGKAGSPKTPVTSSPRQMHISLTGPDIPATHPGALHRRATRGRRPAVCGECFTKIAIACLPSITPPLKERTSHDVEANAAVERCRSRSCLSSPSGGAAGTHVHTHAVGPPRVTVSPASGDLCAPGARRDGPA